MIKTYKNGQEFLAENELLLLKDKYASSLMLLNSHHINDTNKMLDSSREYWLSKGIKDWGIVLDDK